MKKNRIRIVIVIAILIAVFNLIAFIVPFSRTAAFWVSYAFGMVALFLQLFTWTVRWDKLETLKSKFLGIPILQIGFVYLVVQMIVSLGFFVFSALPFQIPLIIDAILLAVCAILMIGADIGRDVIEGIEEKIAAKISFIKSIQTDIELLKPQAKTPELKKQLQDLAETIRYSDPVSNAAVVGIEARISQVVAELSEEIKSENCENTSALVSDVKTLIEERNAKVRLEKL